MIYKIQDKKIKRLLEKKEELFDEVNVINRRIVEDDKARKKLVYKAERIKEKIKPLMKKHYQDGSIKINSPIEVPTRLALVNGVIEIEIVNQVEEYEKMLLEKSKQTKK